MDKESSGAIVVIQVSYYMTEINVMVITVILVINCYLAILSIVIMAINEKLSKINGKIAAVKSVGIIMVHYYYTWLWSSIL